MDESLPRATADVPDAGAYPSTATASHSLLQRLARRRSLLVATFTLMLLATATVLVRPPLWVGAVAGLAIAAVVPGLLLATAFVADRALSRLELGLLTVGLGYACLQLIVLALQALPGPLLRNHVLAAFWIVYLLLAFASVRIGTAHPGAGGTATSGRSWLPGLENQPRQPRSQAAQWGLVAVLVVAAVFRFAYLGYSEFQGDEARAMLLAAAVLDGHDDALLVHKKGPGEVVFPATPYALLQRTDERDARIPFALASLAALLAVYALGERGFRGGVGLVAASLLAVDGFQVAFARIVQYQSLVLLGMTLSVFCYLRFYQRRRCPADGDVPSAPTAAFAGLDWSYLAAGAALAGLGMLAHYEAVFALPAMAVLFVARGWHERWPLGAWVQRTLLPGLVLAAVLAVFYVPFARHPHFGQTFTYIAERRVGTGITYNNIGDFFHRTTFYNSTYYIVFLALAGVAVVIQRMWAALRHRSRGRWLSWSAASLFLAGLIAVLAWPGLFVVGDLNLAFLVFLLPLAVPTLAPDMDAAFRANVVWFAMPFFAVMFFVVKPVTHGYTMFPAWALLTGVGVVAAWQWVQAGPAAPLNARPARWLLAALAAGLFLLFAYHTWFVLVSHSPEYKRVYPAARNALYWTAWDEPPNGGFFGFPYRAGWKVIGELFHAGVLNGDFDSNEEELITGWYTHGAVRCSLDPEYYIVAKNVQDRVKIPTGQIESDYHLVQTVAINGEEKLWVYQRGAADGPATVRRLADYATAFDREVTDPTFSFAPALGEPLVQHPVSARLGDAAELIGYDLDTRSVAPGGHVGLVLYWRALAPVETNYTVFTHIETDEMWGQRDNIPACGRRPTVAWEPDEVVVDPYSIPMREDAPPGEYPLLVGMYDGTTGERLPVALTEQPGARRAAGEPVISADKPGQLGGPVRPAVVDGNSLRLATITVP